jgi:hypothetical protein
MRFALLAMCGAALVGCSDAKAPTDPFTRKSPPSLPSDRRPVPLPRIFDGRPIGIQLEDLVSRRFSQVNLPPDAVSLSSDAVHPDIACPSEWNGSHCWLVYTPYKNSDPSYENPAFLLAGNDTTWMTPPDVRNPIVSYPGAGQYNSDPDHAYDPGTGRLVQVYRVVTATSNDIMATSTATAKQWSQPVLAFSEPRHDAVSPTLVIKPNRLARMWYVRTGANGCGASASSVRLRTAQLSLVDYFENAKWSDPIPVNMSIPGYVIWHIDVDDLPHGGGYLAFIAAFPVGTSCSNSDLWLATSGDGLTWHNFAIPLLWRGMRIATSRSISTWYRGTIRYDAATDSLHLWPSALAGRNWSVYHVALPLERTLQLLQDAQPTDMRSLKKVPPKPTRIPMP